MTNIILPIAYWLISIGDTINIRTYDENWRSIYNVSDIVENPVNTLNSTYFVLRDDEYPAFGIPIDMVMNSTKQVDWLDYSNKNWVGENDYTAAEFFTVTEYVKSKLTLNEGAKPFRCWIDRGKVPFDHTHYVDEMEYGGKLLTRFTIRSNVSGDAQVLRRILTDVMGKSGNVDEHIVDLYKEALKTIRASEDVRGEIDVFYNYVPMNVFVPYMTWKDPEVLLGSLNELARNATVPEDKDGYKTKPLFVSYQPLHDLDGRFTSIQKNVVSEQYLLRLYKILKDLDATHDYVQLLKRYPQLAEQQKLTAFEQKVHSVQEDVKKLLEKELSIFKDIDANAFEKVFQHYENGLNKSTETYFTEFRRLREEIAVTCENRFLTPTRGSLIVEENEIEEKGVVESLSECQDLCLEEERCRAVGYATSNKQCVLYYRSTYSARIDFPKESSPEFKIYDRYCQLVH